MTSSAERNNETSNVEPELCEGLVFNIQRHSIHDGPGIRTVLFLKGCGLRCLWCANPESQSFQPELLFNPEKCIGCGACLKECPNKAIIGGEDGLKFISELCTSCGACCEVCYAGARTMEGRRMTAEAAVLELSKDTAFFSRSGGGVTLSGGEPLSQPAFVEAVLRLCRGRNLPTAVETAGLAPWSDFERILPFTELFLFDLKHVSPEIHAQFTGVDNLTILANLRLLSKRTKALILRTPLIPGFNDEPRDLSALADLAEKLGLREIHFLPYHRYGSSKYRLLRRPYPMGEIKELSREKAEEIIEPLRSRGLEIKIGG